jgi:hypothetical protein
MSTHREQVEAFLKTLDGKAFAEEWNVRSYEDFNRVLEGVEKRTKAAGAEVRAAEPPPVDPDEWMTNALKRSAAVAEEINKSTMLPEYRGSRL